MKAKYIIVVSLLAFCLVLACKNKNLPKTDPEQVVSISEQWSALLNNGNSDSLIYIYADSVLLYGQKLGKYQVVSEKAAFISQYPNFKHVIDSISAVSIDEGIYKTNFTKKVTYGDKEVTVNAMLILQRQNDKWVIVSESDEPTEIKLEREVRRTEEEARKMKTLTFEQKVALTGILGTTTYTDASGNKYAVYIVTLTKPVNVKAPNKYYDSQTDVKEIQVGFHDDEDPKNMIGDTITVSGEIYGEDTIHDRRPVVMINATIHKK